mmetsp:Transcript_86950/g.170136  ORF Transcript_86950/g.170136 Transcript_86950/m.170136 type:complete len:82 (+) Transcript_86950:86-331(+)
MGFYPMRPKQHYEQLEPICIPKVCIFSCANRLQKLKDHSSHDDGKILEGDLLLPGPIYGGSLDHGWSGYFFNGEQEPNQQC